MKKLAVVMMLGLTLLAFGGAQALAQIEAHIDFETDPGLAIFGNAELRTTGGNPNGYLSVTDAANGQRGAIVFPDLTGGATLTEFSIMADLRVGGGTDRPADGFSFNFARPGDPVLDDGEDWATSPTGEANLPEEGTTTGLAIGFDEWFSGGDNCAVGVGDCVGFSVRVDNVILAEVELPTLNGALGDITSLQTGDRGPAGPGDISDLGWATLQIDVTRPGGGDMAHLDISWKGNLVFDDDVLYPAGPGQLVFGGRTGGANAAHHIDNIWITGVPEPGSLALGLTGMGFLSMWFRRRRRG